MCKLNKIKNLIIEEAQQSNMNFKHGAILTKGSKTLAKGYNKPRSKFMNVLQTCIHAELDVVHNYTTITLHKNIHLQKKMNHINELSKCTLWVGRLTNSGNLAGSKPCNNCLFYLKKMGIKKIGYSTNNGTMCIEKINNISNDHLSDAQYKLNTLSINRKMCP